MLIALTPLLTSQVKAELSPSSPPVLTYGILPEVNPEKVAPVALTAPVTVRLPPSVTNPVPVVIGALVVVFKDKVLPVPKSMVEAVVPVIALDVKVRDANA